MKKFVFLTYGFEKPTQEIMTAWGTWFESFTDRIVEQAGFSFGKEISKEGTRDLPLSTESITGFMIVNAKNIEEAQKIAQECPIIKSIRVYEIRSM